MKPFCRYAPSLGALEGTPEQVWGTRPYAWKYRGCPTVFFGLYDLRDYLALWLHKGKKWILWAGSDIRNLENGFAFNDGKLHWLSKVFKGWFTKWIIKVIKSAENWTENRLEADALERLGIYVEGIKPSFMGNIDDFKVNYRHEDKCNVYLCSPEGRQEEYGFGVIERIAKELPHMTFHLFGTSDWQTKHKNVIVHGRIPKEKMNKLIRKYQIGLRLNEFDGFSEILAKAVLQGQYAIGRVQHPKIPTYENDLELITTLNSLRHKYQPNDDARIWYRLNLNRYPWNCL